MFAVVFFFRRERVSAWFFFFSSRRRHTRCLSDWSSDVCSSDLLIHFGSLEDVGLFGIGSRIAGLSALLILGIQAALTPLVYQHYREPETPHQVARLFGWFTAVALAGCLFLAVFARDLLAIFATAEYIRGASLVVFLAPALLLSQMYIFAPGIAIRKKTIWQLWVTLLSAAVSAAGNWLLV